MSRIYQFKYVLSRVFDDNLKTIQWKNWLDYTIIGLILLSMVEVFLSTFDGITEKYGPILHFIDILTTVFFTIEVSLRIWCADLQDDRFKGLWGRVRYCFTFYGFIDLISTYTFYLTLFIPVNYAPVKSLRIVRMLRIFRLFRVFRYLKAIRLMGKALQKCKRELIISIQFLCIITLILSFLLFFVEHEVQPEVYDNGWMSVAWAFAQYVGDPGGFGDTPPVTAIGQVIAFIVGILGVAIFAIPDLERKANAIILRIAWSVTCWDMRAIQIAKDMADVMNRHLEPEVEKTISAEMKIKDIAYDGYEN